MSEANASSDLERAEHLGYSDSKGVKRVSVFNDGVQTNVATEATLQELLTNLGGEPVNSYALSYVLNGGNLDAGTIATTLVSDLTYLTIEEDVSTGIDIDLNFSSPDRTAQFFSMIGYYNGGG